MSGAPSCGGAGAPSIAKYMPPHRKRGYDGPFVPVSVHNSSKLLSALPVPVAPGKFRTSDLLEFVNSLETLGDRIGTLTVFDLNAVLQILASDWSNQRTKFTNYGDAASFYVKLAFVVADYLMIPSFELKSLKRASYKAGGRIRDALVPEDRADIVAHFERAESERIAREQTKRAESERIAREQFDGGCWRHGINWDDENCRDCWYIKHEY